MIKTAYNSDENIFYIERIGIVTLNEVFKLIDDLALKFTRNARVQWLWET